MKEQGLMNAIIIAVGARPDTLVIRVNAGRFQGWNGGAVKGAAPGTSDLVLCVAGNFLALEVKTDTGRQSDAQHRFQSAVEARGGVYRVVRSSSEAIAAVECLARSAR